MKLPRKQPDWVERNRNEIHLPAKVQLTTQGIGAARATEGRRVEPGGGLSPGEHRLERLRGLGGGGEGVGAFKFMIAAPQTSP